MFLLKSSNQHGIHSPFVFDLATKCFYDQTKYSEYSVLKQYRQSLLQNQATIEVTDFGAGSKVFRSNARSISRIAKIAGISAKRGELLFRIANYLKPGNILELGTSLGLATIAMSVANRESKITTLEGCLQTGNIAQHELDKSDATNIDMVVTEFKDYLNQHIASSKFELIYFDGNHKKQATLDYIELLLPTVTNETLWIFDDIHWSPEMEATWEVIKNLPGVTVTIDTFQWGLVFFRSEQKKEHFIVRV